PRTRLGGRRRLACRPMSGARRPVGRALLAAAVLVCGLVITTGRPARAAGTPPPNAFILVDAGTGEIITSRNVHEPLPPASTAKILTALVAVERLPPDAVI